MAARQSSPTSNHSQSNGSVRKRVAQCDGANPCGRCRTDNTICVFGERQKAHNKVYPKGYVEMLEYQQTWLVNGLQEMYRRALEGEGWPGAPLKCEVNGRPLTHNLLTRLGALDHAKSKRFKENTETIQQDLWRQNVGDMQRQESSDGSSESAQSPINPSCFSDPFSRQLSSTQSSFSTLAQAQGPTLRSEPQMAPTNPAFVTPMTMQGVVNPLALQTPQQWPSNHFGVFEDVDLKGASEYTNLSFNDHVPSLKFNGHLPMSCILSFYMDTTDDYEDVNQILNANAPEIAST
ncbi:hypothetical protein CBS147353_11038 [Aspergillus niger]|nr:hypothetical protein CBS147353_11038 [Aspergillus niger]